MTNRVITIKAEYQIELDEYEFKQLQKVMRVRKIGSVKSRLKKIFLGLGSDFTFQSEWKPELDWIRCEFNEIICRYSNYTDDYNDDGSKCDRYWSDFLWSRFHLEPKVDVTIE